MRIYIAGSYSGNTLEFLDNIRRGIRAGTKLLLKGYAPFVPWLDHQLFLQLREDESISVETIRNYSLEWLKVSDCVLVLPNSEGSAGTKEELRVAKELGIPVYYRVEDLEETKIPVIGKIIPNKKLGNKVIYYKK